MNNILTSNLYNAIEKLLFLGQKLYCDRDMYSRSQYSFLSEKMTVLRGKLTGRKLTKKKLLYKAALFPFYSLALFFSMWIHVPDSILKISWWLRLWKRFLAISAKHLSVRRALKTHGSPLYCENYECHTRTAFETFAYKCWASYMRAQLPASRCRWGRNER